MNPSHIPEESHRGRAESFGVGGQCLNRLARSAEHGRVSLARMAASEMTKLLGHGERHQEVMTRQQLGQLAFKPVRAFVALAPTDPQADELATW